MRKHTQLPFVLDEVRYGLFIFFVFGIILQCVVQCNTVVLYLFTFVEYLFLQKVVDTVYSLLDVAADGAADVVNIKVAVQIELNEQPNFLSKTKLSAPDQQVWGVDQGETGGRALLFAWHCHDH